MARLQCCFNPVMPVVGRLNLQPLSLFSFYFLQTQDFCSSHSRGNSQPMVLPPDLKELYSSYLCHFLKYKRSLSFSVFSGILSHYLSLPSPIYGRVPSQPMFPLDVSPLSTGLHLKLGKKIFLLEQRNPFASKYVMPEECYTYNSDENNGS